MKALWLLAFASTSGPLSELVALDRDIAALTAQLSQLEVERQSIAIQVARLEAERAAAEVERQEVLPKLAARVRALARMPAGARMLMLGRVDGFSDYLAARRVLRVIAEHDHQLHTRFQKTEQDLTRLRQELEQRAGHLVKSEATLREAREFSAARRRERVSVVQRILADGKLTRAHLDASERALVVTLDKLIPASKPNQSFSQNKGRLPWPTSGRMSAKFGEVVELATGTTTTRNGIDVEAPAGAVVQAVAAGSVVFADWMEGFGQVVIVDHGGSHHTVSAHLGELSVRVGDNVAVGRQLGLVGDSGLTLGSVLYFEVREHGIAQDPILWLKR
jgi:murein hydrolase activator